MRAFAVKCEGRGIGFSAFDFLERIVEDLLPPDALSPDWSVWIKKNSPENLERLLRGASGRQREIWTKTRPSEGRRMTLVEGCLLRGTVAHLKAALEAGAALYCSPGCSPLTLALWDGQPAWEMCARLDLLKAAGADPADAREKPNGEPLLRSLVRSKSFVSAGALVDRFESAGCPDDPEHSMFHAAQKAGAPKALMVALAKAGYDPNIFSGRGGARGQSPLMRAVEARDVETALNLLAAGADPEARPYPGGPNAIEKAADLRGQAGEEIYRALASFAEAEKIKAAAGAAAPKTVRGSRI